MIPMGGGSGTSGGVLRYREGNVTVTLDGGLAAAVRKALDAAAGETIRLMEAEAQAVADAARQAWYGSQGVTRKTGQSGDIRIVTTVTPNEVRVGVGSTDARVSGGRMVAIYVRRPGRLSVIRKQVTRDEWWSTPEAMRANYRPRRAGKDNPADPAGSGPYIYVPNPLASDGRQLMQELVRKPMTARMKVLPTALRDAILARVRR
jgi:hypothetical protein